MTLSETTTANGTKLDLRQGCNGSGQTIFVLFVETPHGETAMHKFETESEAASWMKWSYA